MELEATEGGFGSGYIPNVPTVLLLVFDSLTIQTIYFCFSFMVLNVFLCSYVVTVNRVLCLGLNLQSYFYFTLACFLCSNVTMWNYFYVCMYLNVYHCAMFSAFEHVYSWIRALYKCV